MTVAGSVARDDGRVTIVCPRCNGSVEVRYYGPCDDRPVTEEAPAGRDFLARVCVQWEDEARRASASKASPANAMEARAVMR